MRAVVWVWILTSLTKDFFSGCNARWKLFFTISDRKEDKCLKIYPSTVDLVGFWFLMSSLSGVIVLLFAVLKCCSIALGESISMVWNRRAMAGVISI